jgi:hypothetical protein
MPVQKYYIWSRKHSPQKDNIYFWRSNGRGYTRFLEEAGLFGSEHEQFYKKLNTKRQVSYAWHLDKYIDDSFLIPINKLEILGIKKTIIIN